MKLLTKAATYTLYTGSAHTMDRTLQQAPTTSAGALGAGGPGAAPALGLPPPPECPVLSPWASSSAPLTSWERRLRAISRMLQFLENRQPTSSIPNTCNQTHRELNVQKRSKPEELEFSLNFCYRRKTGHV